MLTLNPHIDKSFLLLSKLFSNPSEFYHRLTAIAEVKSESRSVAPPHYKTSPLSEVHAQLSALFHVDIQAILQESACQEITYYVEQKISQIGQHGPFNTIHNSDFTLAQLCYAVCRVLKPNVVIETGVAYGVNSAHILQALAVNQQGMLHSIDLPPLGRQESTFIGSLIPQPLKTRWHLHRGPSKQLLPQLLSQLKHVDLFVHDSLHTYKTMEFELKSATRYMSGGMMIADDIESNPAFLEWIKNNSPKFQAAVQEKNKNAIFGVAVLG